MPTPPFAVATAIADPLFGVGSKLIRTDAGWRVERANHGAIQVGDGKTLERAFATIGATYDLPDPNTGVRVLRDINGNILPPE